MYVRVSCQVILLFVVCCRAYKGVWSNITCVAVLFGVAVVCVCVRVSVCSHVVVNVSVRIVMCCVFWLCIGSILLPVTADDDGSVEVSKHADDCLTAKQVRTDKPQLCIYGDRPYMLGHWRSPVVMCLCGVCLGLSLWSLFGCAKPFLVRGWCCQTARSCMC